MFGGTAPPLFIPLGFTGEDFENLLALLGGMFDVMTFTEDHVALRNSTNNNEYDTYLDSTTGRITFMGGWMNMPGGDDTTWNYLSIYPMFNETLHSGTNSISVPNDAISEITTSHIDIITDNTGVELVNAILAYNPTNTSITNGTVLYYNDLLITNTTGLENLTFYIKFDDSFDLDNYNLIFWAWNMSGNNAWEAAPPSASSMFIYDYIDNSLTINFPVSGGSGSLSITMAVSYVYIGPPEITVNSPTPSQVVGSLAPSYDISITGSYDSVWYTLDGGVTNFTASSLTGTINQAAWDMLSDGTITIIFFANNSFGREGNTQVQVIKDSSEEPAPGIPGYDFYLLIGALSVISAILIRKRMKS